VKYREAANPERHAEAGFQQALLEPARKTPDARVARVRDVADHALAQLLAVERL
jgi:hypothetical protein